MSPLRVVATTVVAALMVASCTEIGPTIPVGPGAGKSHDEFERDRKVCMAATDQALQPVATRANLQATTTQDVVDSNQRIQVAYDQSFDTCMASRGNLVPAPTVPPPSVPMPPSLPPALANSLPVSDASNMPDLADPESLDAKASVSPKVRALLAACPGETIAVAAYDAPLRPGITARLVALTQPNGGDCLGHIGESDLLIIKAAGGNWRTVLAAEPGSIGIRAGSHGGYRDVELRSFGSCVYGYRWNGQAFYPAAADTHDCTLPAPVAPGSYADAIRER